MNENPGDSFVPSQPSAAGTVATTEGVLSQLAQKYLEQTRPWVRFMSVLVFAGAGLMVLVAVGVIALVAVGGSAMGDRAGFGIMGAAAVGFFYLMLACLYIAPGVFLHRYAAAIKTLQATSTAGALEDAFRHQRSFWRYVGIMSAVALAVAVLGLALMLAAGIIGAMIAARH